MNGVATQVGNFGISDRDFAEVARILHRETGIVVTEAKRAMVVSRLSLRARSLRLPSIAAYCGLISSDQERAKCST
jgi:chemotaxis protein methyltransferase CheR